MLSTRAGAVETLFLSYSSEPVSATMRARTHYEIGVQNTCARYLDFVCFAVVLGAQGAPKDSPGRLFYYHFRYFLHDLGGWSLKAGSDVQFQPKSDPPDIEINSFEPEMILPVPKSRNLQINKLSSVK